MMNGVDSPFITLMFDDGFSDVYHEALPMLENFGYKANVALIGSKINQKGYLTTEQVKELLSKKWGLSDHSYSHINFQKANAQTMKREIVKNKKLVSDLFGYELMDFVFPQSKLSSDSLSLILSYYPIVFTGTTKVRGNAPPFKHRLLIRVEVSTYEVLIYGLHFSSFIRKLKSYLKALSNEKRGEWLILFAHRVTDKPGLFDISMKKFNVILNAIDAAGIPVITTSEAMRNFL